MATASTTSIACSGLAADHQSNTQITNEQFKDIVERTTGVTHLNGDIMLYADSYVELGHKATAERQRAQGWRSLDALACASLSG